MIAIDTNILVYARRREMGAHAQARDLVATLAEGEEAWAIPWPCVYEFLRVVTHPGIFNPPSDLKVVLDELELLLESPALVMLGEGPRHLSHMIRMMTEGRATGNIAHDAHIAALVVEHGVRELWTTDKDFARFPGLRVRNPFVDTGVSERRARYATGMRLTRRRKRTVAGKSVR